jgi:hypothetical protein
MSPFTKVKMSLLIYQWMQDFKLELRHQLASNHKKSSKYKWTCPECGLNARIGIKGNPEIRHEPCEQKTGHTVFFVQADGKSHTIFKNGK